MIYQFSGLFFVLSSLLGWRSTPRTSLWRRIPPLRVVLRMCLVGNYFSCKCFKPVWIEGTYGDWWEGIPYFSHLFSAEVWYIYKLMCLGPGRPKDPPWRIHIHMIWRIWLFCGEVSSSLLLWTGFITLILQMSTQGRSDILVTVRPGSCPQIMRIW